MSYVPGEVPQGITPEVGDYLRRELERMGNESRGPNPEFVRWQRWNGPDEPPRPADGDVFYFPGIAGSFDPGSGHGFYWHDGIKWRLAFGINEDGILGGAADSVIILDAPDYVQVTNYALEANSDLMTLDPVAGTITLPNQSGWVSLNLFLQLEQVTNIRDCSVVGYLFVNGVAGNPFGSGYIPQQSGDIPLFISASFSRPVNGGEVLDIRLQLDGASSATFDILNTTFEVGYIPGAVNNVSNSTFTPGQLP